MVDERDEPRSGSSLATGFPCLDAMMAGHQPMETVLLAARPSIGKTSLALNIARNLAVDDRKSVVVFSLELTKEEVMSRLVAMEAGVDSWRVRRDKMSADEQTRMEAASAVLAAASLHIEHSASMDADEIDASLTRLKQAGTTPVLVIVDYLQLMPGVADAGSEPDQAARLKAVAHRHSVPFLILARLGFREDRASGPRPVLADVAGLDADLTLLLYRDEVYNRDSTEKGTVEVIAGRSDAPIGVCKLRFDSACGRFFSPE